MMNLLNPNATPKAKQESSQIINQVGIWVVPLTDGFVLNSLSLQTVFPAMSLLCELISALKLNKRNKKRSVLSPGQRQGQDQNITCPHKTDKAMKFSLMA